MTPCRTPPLGGPPAPPWAPGDTPGGPGHGQHIACQHIRCYLRNLTIGCITHRPRHLVTARLGGRLHHFGADNLTHLLGPGLALPTRVTLLLIHRFAFGHIVIHLEKKENLKT